MLYCCELYFIFSFNIVRVVILVGDCFDEALGFGKWVYIFRDLLQIYLAPR